MLQPIKYSGRIRKNDARFLEEYSHLEQYTQVEFGKTTIMIGSLVKLKRGVKPYVGEEISIGRSDMAQVTRIIKGPREEAIIAVMWYYSYTSAIGTLPLDGVVQSQFPNLCTEDIFWEKRAAPLVGTISMDNISEVSSMVSVNVKDDPKAMIKIAETVYCYRFDVTSRNGKTMLTPAHLEVIKMDLNIYSNKTLKDTFARNSLVEAENSPVSPSTSRQEEKSASPQVSETQIDDSATDEQEELAKSGLNNPSCQTTLPQRCSYLTYSACANLYCSRYGGSVDACCTALRHAVWQLGNPEAEESAMTAIPKRRLLLKHKDPASSDSSFTISDDENSGLHKSDSEAERPFSRLKKQCIHVNDIWYIKGELLGKGGSSEVIQVFRIDDDAELALKIVNLKVVDGSVRQSFLNEIDFLKRMQGFDTVVQLIDHEYYEEEDLLLVVMEKGVRDLTSFLIDRFNEKDMKLSTLKDFWFQMVEAVSAIHSQGIIHCDLKPANFLICGEIGLHKLKLIDFGLASSLQTGMTSVIKEQPAGTINYMSPEALQGSEFDFKNDIWSLGCILYCLLYGYLPFQHIGKNVNHKVAVITNPKHEIEFPETSEILPDGGKIPQALYNTVKKCLSFQPQERPTSKDLLEIKYCGCQ